MEVMKRYQKTEVGVIPQDWGLHSLNELVDPNRTIRYGIVQPGKYDPNGRFMVRGQDYSFGWVDESYFFRVSSAIEERYKNARLKAGDLIITIVGASTGHVEVVPEWLAGANLTQTTARIAIDSSKADVNYCKYYLASKSGQSQVANYLKGAAQPGLNCGDVEKFQIPLPPTLTEQRAIATALSDVDRLLSAYDQLIAKKKAIKQGAMQELLKPKSGWAPKNLGEIAEVVGGGTPSTFIPEYWNGTINWFTPTEIGTEKYLYESNRRITKEGLNNCSAKILPTGTVLLTTRAGIGDVGILMSEGCTNQGFQSLIARDGYNNEFIYYLMHTLKNTLIQNASGSTFLEISPGKIKQIEVVIPDHKEQAAIAQILTDMDAEIAALERQRDKYKAVKQGMMQELLTGKTRLI